MLRLTVEAEVATIERQAARVDALDAGGRRAADADTADEAARRAFDRLPEGGELIEIGHHSETRHRNAIEKAHNAMGRSVEAARARARADVAAHTTEHRYASGMVARRIDRIDTDIRGYTRKTDGSTHNFGGGYIETTAQRPAPIGSGCSSSARSLRTSTITGRTSARRTSPRDR